MTRAKRNINIKAEQVSLIEALPGSGSFTSKVHDLIDEAVVNRKKQGHINVTNVLSFLPNWTEAEIWTLIIESISFLHQREVIASDNTDTKVVESLRNIMSGIKVSNADQAMLAYKLGIESESIPRLIECFVEAKKSA
jgi:hypothetical protein